MLSLFPQLLFLSPLGATIVRIAVATVFFYAARKQSHNVAMLSEVPVPILGKGAWIVWSSVVFDIGIGLLIFLGIYTQAAALIGALGVAASLLAADYLERIPLPRGVAYLTLAILLSLLLTGPGAFAFDLPL